MTDFVKIASFWGPEEALCAQSFLRSRGVESILQNEQLLSVQPWLRFALGGFQLMVLHQDQTLALEQLKSVSTENAESQDDESYDRITVLRWLWVPIALIHAVPFLPNEFSKKKLVFILIFFPWLLYMSAGRCINWIYAFISYGIHGFNLFLEHIIRSVVG